MIIRRIKLQNIRSYSEAEINFPEGSTLLMGDIGSGKTSILLAIEFALFGLQPSQKGNSLLRSNENEALVQLEFEVDDKKVKIERRLKKSGKSISQTDCSITINNDSFEGSVTEIKTKILELLKYPPEFAKKTNDLYKFTVYTPQEEMKQIIMESNDVRLNTLRHVLGIDKYKRIEENIDLTTSRLRQEIKVKETEIGNIEQKKQLLEEKNIILLQEKNKLKDIEKEYQEIEKIKASKQLELEALNKKISEKNKLENEKEKSELTINNKKDILFSYDSEIKSITHQLKDKDKLAFNESEIEIAKRNIQVNEQQLRELNDKYIASLTNMQNNESKMSELRKLIDKISALEKCPTCLQIVNEDYKKNIVLKAKTEFDSISLENKQIKNEKEQENTKMDQLRKSVEIYRNALSEMQIKKVKLETLNEKQKRLETIEKQKNSVLSDIDMMRKHVEQIEKTIVEFEIFEKAFQDENKEFKEIENKERLVVIKRTESSKEIQFLELQIKDIEKEIKKIEELTEKLKYLKELEYWLNNKFIELVLFTEKNVMLKLREEFSKLFSDWFSLLVQDNIAVRLDESFSPIIQQNDYDLDYNFLSGGERTAVALAYRLALNQTINSLLSKIQTRDLVILDEPTDGFSESQLDKMRDIFSQLKVKQLIIVSHEQKIEGFVSNIIRFKKIDGLTQIEK